MTIKRIKDFPDGSGSLSSDDIFIFMDNPSENAVTKKITLSELSNTIGGSGSLGDNYDVNLSGVTNLDGIIYNSNENYWEPKHLVQSETNGIAGASGINNIIQMSEASYNALISKDPNTIYFII